MSDQLKQHLIDATGCIVRLNAAQSAYVGNYRAQLTALTDHPDIDKLTESASVAFKCAAVDQLVNVEANLQDQIISVLANTMAGAFSARWLLRKVFLCKQEPFEVAGAVNACLVAAASGLESALTLVLSHETL